MKIKVSEENKEKINESIKEVEGKAIARVCDYDDVVKTVEEGQSKLNNFNIPKKSQSGMKVSYCEKIGCNSYKYSADTTRIEVTKGSKDWFLTDVRRVQISPSDKSSEYKFFPTEFIIKEVKRKAVENFYK